jgi:beta,beta-carotene 9',10'-dioxygenase
MTAQSSAAQSMKHPTRPRDLSARAPFRARPDDEARFEATVRGAIPEWLRGELVRTAPAVFARSSWEAHHWFDALGLLYAFRVGEGVSYRQRLMGSEVATAASEGRAPRASFGSPIVRSFWKRIFAPIPEVTDNTNVNVVALGDECVALTESPHQWAVDRETLAVSKAVEYRDALSGVSMLAHPHFDFNRGRVVNLGVRIGMKTEIVVYDHPPQARERRVVGSIGVARLPYLHAFGLTERHAIVIGHPFRVSPLSLLWSNRGFIDHFDYQPAEGTTLWLVDRETGAVREHSAPPGFVFHVVNAFEDGRDTSIDVALYPDAGIVSALSTDSIAERGMPDLMPSIVRWTARQGAREARAETLVERGFEFPAVSYKKKNGLRHAVSWGARLTNDATRSSLVRIDAVERIFEEPGFVFGEPTFVARPGSEREDDGVIVAVGSHREADRSAMVVLDGATMQLHAWAEVPVPIPLGFHGSFFRGSA